MENKYFVLVYHVNTQENIAKVVDSYKNGSGELYTSVEDGYWAGNGMYFWDNEGNANYWKKIRHNNYILKANLKIEENCILDLTDKDVLDELDQLWPSVAKKFHIDFDSPPGRKINTICKYLKKIKVVKINGYYPNMHENRIIFKGKKNRKGKPHLTIKSKIIYCVKSADRLENVRQLVREEKKWTR